MVLVLITRPRELYEETARQVERLGYQPMANPLLELVPNDKPLPDGPFDAIFFTSIMAVRACAIRMSDFGTPVLTVGEITCQAAREAGFTQVACLGETVAEAAPALRQRFAGQIARLLYASGEHVADDLARLVALPSLTIVRVPLYDSQWLSLEKNTIDLLCHGEIAWILLFSRRTAMALNASVASLEQPGCTGRTSLACFSPGIAAVVPPGCWRRVAVAAHPTMEALLACLDKKC